MFKAHRLLYHSTLGSRVIKKKKKPHGRDARAVLPRPEAPPPPHRVPYIGTSLIRKRHPPRAPIRP